MEPDHDILIRLEVQVMNLTEKVSVLTDDHEKRIRSLETYVWRAIGGLVVAQILVGIYLALHK